MNDLQIAVVENSLAPQISEESVVRLYDVGRCENTKLYFTSVYVKVGPPPHLNLFHFFNCRYRAEEEDLDDGDDDEEDPEGDDEEEDDLDVLGLDDDDTSGSGSAEDDDEEEDGNILDVKN